LDFATVYVATPLEETHYYPFGLTQKGISTRQTGALHNKEKTFQDQQIDEDLDLNWVQFKYRNHDPQIRRFIEVDPLSEDYVHNSTYAFSENKVTVHVELEGLEAEYIFGKFKRAIADEYQNLSNRIDNAVSYFSKTSSSTEVSSTPVAKFSVGGTVTATTSTNFGGKMNYLIANNTLEGNKEPLLKTTVVPSVDTKTEIKAGTLSSISKTKNDSKGDFTTEIGGKMSGDVKVKRMQLAVSAEATMSTSTSGESKATLQIGVGKSSTTQAIGCLQHGTDGTKQKTYIGIGIQQKQGKTTFTQIFRF